MIAGLVLAAGEGSRFGSQKLLAELGGRPLLEWPLRACEAAPLDRVACVLGAGARAIEGRVDLHGAEVVRCPDWRSGQSASLRAGVAALGDAEAIVIVLGDQPLLSAAAIERVIAGRDPAVAAVRASYTGVPAHPTLVERALYERLLALEGDRGARTLLGEVALRLVPCDEVADPLDVDTEADLEAARARLGPNQAAASSRERPSVRPR